MYNNLPYEEPNTCKIVLNLRLQATNRISKFRNYCLYAKLEVCSSINKLAQ